MNNHYLFYAYNSMGFPKISAYGSKSSVLRYAIRSYGNGDAFQVFKEANVSQDVDPFGNVVYPYTNFKDVTDEFIELIRHSVYNAHSGS